jgi:hypothetical protein
MDAGTGAEREHRYNRLTWAEMNGAIGRQPVVVLPTGSTEQHGRHLPLDVDLLLCESVCLEAGRRAEGGILVLPPVPYGLNLHHIDFPGTIHVEPEVFIAFCLNVTKSVAYHGFEKILIVNGHGLQRAADRRRRPADHAGDGVALRRLPLLLAGRRGVLQPSRTPRRSPTPTSSRPRSTSTWRRSGSGWSWPAPTTT